MRFTLAGGGGGLGEGRGKERAFVSRDSVAEVQTSREFERRPVAVGASTMTRRGYARAR
jgi:hypothetical protein